MVLKIPSDQRKDVYFRLGYMSSAASESSKRLRKILADHEPETPRDGGFFVIHSGELVQVAERLEEALNETGYAY